MKLKTELFIYQQEAVNKLLGLKVGALFMEMGTGKTRTALEIINKRLKANKLNHVLWLCPCSVRENLMTDIRKHADEGFTKIAVYGIESLSNSTRLYGLLLQYVQAGETMLIIDESTLVKNYSAIRTQKIISLAQSCKYRLILNGTPISKSEADLFAQFYILDWRILGYRSFWRFAANHLEYDEKYRHKIRRVLNVDYLTSKISPYSYIIRKDDVLKLPGKKYFTKCFILTPEQREHYASERDDFLDTLINDDDEAAIYRTFTALQEITSGRYITSKVHEHITHRPFFENPIQNPRIQALLETITANGQKTIIWCKFQHEIDDVSRILSEKYGEENVQIFCGKTSPKKRNEALVLFSTKAQYLVANKTCAGFGLNLQFCHKAIYYNNDWNWATRVQSEDRIHRLGQEKEVEIIDIYGLSTIDDRIIKCLQKKEKLSDAFRASVKTKNAKKWIDGFDVKGLDDDKNRS